MGEGKEPQTLSGRSISTNYVWECTNWQADLQTTFYQISATVMKSSSKIHSRASRFCVLFSWFNHNVWWLFCWLTSRLTTWLNTWLTGLLTCWLTVWLVSFCMMKKVCIGLFPETFFGKSYFWVRLELEQNKCFSLLSRIFADSIVLNLDLLFPKIDFNTLKKGRFGLYLEMFEKPAPLSYLPLTD